MMIVIKIFRKLQGKYGRYLDLPHLQIACNWRVASSAIRAATAEKYQHHQWPLFIFPTKDVYLLVRDPVDRFRSAYQIIRSDYGDMDTLLDDMPNDMHLLKQTRFLTALRPVHLYRYPEHLSHFAADVGLELSLCNQSRGPKVELTQNQRDRVLDYYKDDAALFNSISRPALRYK